MTNRIPGSNIFTYDIADILGVTPEVALRVHKHMDEYFPVDWSEVSHEELAFTAMLAFEDLNINVPVDF